MSKKPILSSKKSLTASSLAPLAAQGPRPPLAMAFLQAARQRNVSSSATSKVSTLRAAKSSSGAAGPPRRGQVRAYWMGMRISGTPIWARMEWSLNCTAEWMMLWRWTTIWIFSGGRPNSHTASISSRPLFIRVALSMVILAPMFQLGWRRASSFFLSLSWPAFIPKKGPPEAVSRILVRERALSASCRHWKIAECSLSTGSSLTPCCSTARVTRCPPVTRLSLLARARSCPLSMAARDAPSPAMPTTLFRTTSAPSMAASCRSPSGPRSSTGAPARPARAASSFWAAAGSVTQTARGWNASICCSSRST